MALTRYTINQLTSNSGILGDNVSGDITAQNLRDTVWSLYKDSEDSIIGLSASLSNTTDDLQTQINNISGDNFYTTNSFLSGTELIFNRNDTLSAYSVDLSSLPTPYSNVTFLDAINGNDSSGEMNDFTKPFSTLSQALSEASNMSGLSSTNRSLVYIRRGQYNNVGTKTFIDNVDIYCEPGVVFTGIVQFRTLSPVNSKFLGYSIIETTYTGGYYPVFRIEHESYIDIEFDYIESTQLTFVINIPGFNNQINIKGNYVDTNGLQATGSTLRSFSNINIDLNYFKSMYACFDIRFLRGEINLNVDKIILKAGNIYGYGGNFKQCIVLYNGVSNPTNPGTINVYGDLIVEDDTYYGGLSAAVRYWNSPNQKLKINGDIVAGVCPGVSLSNGSGTYIQDGNISSDRTCIGISGSNKVNIKNSTIIRNTDTFASPFTVVGSSEVYISNSTFYSDFYGNLMNVNSDTCSLYLNNFIAEGFVGLTPSTFINVDINTPTIGLNNVSTNRDYDNNINTSYLINLSVDSNIKVPKFN